MMARGAVAARLKACKRQQCARRSYDASCLALRDGALTGACYLQRDAAKLYAQAQAFVKLADEGADANLAEATWSATMTVPLLTLMVRGRLAVPVLMINRQGRDSPPHP